MDLKQTINIGNKLVGGDSSVFIIAEIGINHNGDVHLAEKMIEEAAKCGVDAVKFQTVCPEASYPIGSEVYRFFKDTLLTEKEYIHLKNVAEANQVIMFTTLGDEESLNMVKHLDFPVIKISSGSMTNIPMLKKVATLKKPIMVSTGMSFLGEVEHSVYSLMNAGCDEVMLFHCTSNYPTAPMDVNLRAMQTLMSTFRVPTGLSDHTEGTLASATAVALGTKLIEKHFTLNKNMEGPDQYFSMEPSELKQLVQHIRTVEAMLGSWLKKPTESELERRVSMRRYIVAAKSVRKGEIITHKTVTIRRPNMNNGRGLDPIYWEEIMGKRFARDLKEDDPITLGSIVD